MSQSFTQSEPVSHADLKQLIRLDRELHRRACRTDLKTWCIEALSALDQTPAKHHLLMIEKLEAVARGDIDRLMILAPPGSAKSTYVSVLFVAWFLAQHPHSAIIAASHTVELAERFGRKVRNTITEHARTLGYGLSATNKAAGRWETDSGGEYFAAGISGPITGRRADLVVIDDPVKGRIEADSEPTQRHTWEWWQSDLSTRLKPGARVVLVMTRWNVADLGGKLLEDMRTGGKKWDVLSLPMEAGLSDPLNRLPGELLWPDWFNADMVKQAKRDTRTWSALYQQRPTADEGAILLRTYWRPWTDPVPEKPTMVLISLDPAYTEKSQNDPSAFTVWHVVDTPYRPQPDKPGKIAASPDMRVKLLLRYAWSDRLEFPDLIDTISDAVKTFRIADVPFRLLVEDKACGLSVIQEMRRRMPGLGLFVARGIESKVARAHSITEIMSAGRVYALARMQKNGAGDDAETVPDYMPWAQSVIDECATFPVGAHDDLTDSVTHALRHIRDLGVELFPEDMPAQPDSVERAALY